jgi:hypothetical protein
MVSYIGFQRSTTNQMWLASNDFHLRRWDWGWLAAIFVRVIVTTSDSNTFKFYTIYIYIYIYICYCYYNIIYVITYNMIRLFLHILNINNNDNCMYMMIYIYIYMIYCELRWSCHCESGRRDPALRATGHGRLTKDETAWDGSNFGKIIYIYHIIYISYHIIIIYIYHPMIWN